MRFVDNVWVQMLLSLCLGLSLTFAFAPFNYAYLTLFSLTFFLLLVVQTQHPKLIGFAYGLGWFGAGISWVHVSIAEFGGVPLLVSLLLMGLLVSYLALFVMLFSFSIHQLHVRFGRTWALALAPILWLGMEALRSILFTGFPWLSLGYSQINSILGQLAPIVGETGITTLLMILASCAVYILTANKPSSPNQQMRLPSYAIKYSAYFCIGLVFTTAWFAPQWHRINLSSEDHDSRFSVGVVQGNIEQSMRWIPELDQPIMEKYLHLSEMLWDKDVVIWPEAAVPKLESEAQVFLRQLDAQAYATNTGLITGIVNYDFGRDMILNQLIALGRKNADLDQPQYYYGHNNRFAKHHLLPIGEFIPFEKWLRGLAPIFDLPMSSFTRGAYIQENLQANGLWFVPAICFEIVFPRQIRANITSQSNAIITVSNDAWFGNSHGPHQHMQIAQMRALEFGLPVIRVTNNGITGIIDHHGQIQSRLPQFAEGVLVDTLITPAGSTYYRQYGDIIPLCLALLWLLFNTLFGPLINITKRIHNVSISDNQS